MRAAIYARVSTAGQTPENQVRELPAVAAQRGWRVVEVYSDDGVSGAKGRDRRPRLDALLKASVRREHDVVMAWSVDRLGRSLQHLVGLLAELQGAGVELYLHQQALDTTTPSGRALFGMLGVFSEYERAMIVERVRAGMARARAAGTHVGRPRLPAAKERAIRAALQAGGKGMVRIARENQVGNSTVARIKAELAERAA